MASQSTDKLLFQVELVPPNAGNIKTVSQAINRVENAQQGATNATQQNIKATDAQKAKYDQIKTSIRDLETATKSQENATRFADQATEKSLKTQQQQLNQLLKLKKRIESLNLTHKQRSKLMSQIQTKRRTMELSMQKVRTGWKGMSTEVRRGNRLLLQSGRILQDLPFGFMGISNNIQQLVTSFGRGSNAGLGFKDMLLQIKTSMMGTGGIIFLLGSVLPFAMTVASNGFMGFKDMLGSTSDKATEFKDEMKSLVDSIVELRTVQGDDPLGIQDVESRIRGVQSILSSLDHIVERQEKIKTLGNQSRVMYGAQETEISAQQRQLQEIVEREAKRFGLTVEQFNKLKEQEESLNSQLETLVKMGRIEPAQAFEIKELDEANELIERFNLGIRKVGGEETVSALRDQRKRIKLMMNAWQASAETGNKDVLPFLRAGKNVLEDINSTLDEIPKKPSVELDLKMDEDGMEIPDLTDFITEGMADLGDFELFDSEALKKKRAKFLQSLSDRTFKIQQELSSDLVALELSTQRQINNIQENARELGLSNAKEVQRAITAIRRREAKKRFELERDRERQLRDAKMNMWSQSQSFIQTVNENILGNSKAVALISLAIEKGLEIAKVASKTSEKVADLQQMAGLAGVKASLASADSISAFASGNVAKGLGKANASKMYRKAQASAHAQSAKVGGIGAKTIALIAGQTLAEGAGILSGGGSGGGSTSSSTSGGGISQVNQGFNEFDNPDQGDGRRGGMIDAVVGAVREMKRSNQMRPVFNFHGDLDKEVMSIKVEEGRRTRESNAIVIGSDTGI